MSQTKIWRAIAAVSLSIAFYQTPTVVLGAEAGAEEEAGNGLQEIIVTARRKEENVQSVPIMVNVVTEDALVKQDVRTFTDLAALTPAVDTCCARGSVSQFTFIRGINSAVGYFAEVPTLLNGSAFYFDIGNVEVLKGPQGTLFGIATNGGAVLVEPAKPTQKLEGYTSISLGDYGRTTYEGVINLPVSDTLAFRIGVQREQRDGYVHDITNDRDLGNEDYWTTRVSAQWDITDRLQNYFVWNYHMADELSAPLGTPYGPTAGIAPGGLFGTVFAGPALNAWIARSVALGNYSYSIVGEDVTPRDVLRQHNVTDITTYSLTDDLKIKNIVGYYSVEEHATADTDGSPFPGYETGIAGTYFGGPTVQWSEELQLQGDAFDKHLSYVVGSFNRWNNVRDPGIIYQDVLGAVSATQSVQSGRTHSIFGEGTFKLDPWIPGLAVTAGYRETWDERAASQVLYGSTGVPLTNFDAQATWAKGSYRMGLTYTPIDSTMFYFTNSKGYSVGGFNLTAPDAADQRYNPEVLNNFEVGAKSEWTLLGIRGRTNFAAYFGRYDEIQAQVTTRCQTATGPVLCQLTRNAAQGQIDGGELEFTVLPTDWWTLSGNAGFMEGRYTNYKGLDPTGTIQLDLSDTAFLYLPKWKYSVQSTVKLPTPDAVGKLSFTPVWTWTDKINCCFTAGPAQYYTTSPAVKNLNVTVDLADLAAVKGLTGSFTMTNVTNNDIMHGQWGVYEQLGQYARAVAVPRMWYFSLRYDF